MPRLHLLHFLGVSNRSSALLNGHLFGVDELGGR
jgi:hypothetical protein